MAVVPWDPDGIACDERSSPKLESQELQQDRMKVWKSGGTSSNVAGIRKVVIGGMACQLPSS